MLHVVLVEPEIPPNTGNAARMCLAAGVRLHLIEPLGFQIDDRQLRRAGMDYWKLCDIHYWPDLSAWAAAHPKNRKWYFTTKTDRVYWDATFADGDALIFGKETRGLPESLLTANSEQLLTIPMTPEARSLNLGTSVGIATYEALRQIKMESRLPDRCV
ncbi:MAG: tRNA (cytidine(34)-2'-O)-methyltransferase [Chthoniobacterales bacterium]